ncbi:MAG TPA: hypothetical protein VH475_08355 [Tepidisphaeraceae bacterium]
MGPPLRRIAPTLIGTWSGSHASTDPVYQGTLSLKVSEARHGELFAALDFTGKQSFQVSGQLTYDQPTGRLSLLVLSPKLVVKVTMTLGGKKGHGAALEGEIEYYTPQTSYNGTFGLNTLP